MFGGAAACERLRYAREEGGGSGQDFEQVFSKRIEGLVLLPAEGNSEVSVKCSFGLELLLQQH